MAENKGTLVVGLSLPQASPDAAGLLLLAREDGYDYVTTTLLPYDPAIMARTDVTDLESRWWRTSVVGTVSEEWLPQKSSNKNIINNNKLEALQAQMDWATHMSIPAVLLPSLPNNTNYMRAISAMVPSNGGQVWIRTKLTQESLDAFCAIQTASDGASHVGLLLEMEPIQLPAASAASAMVANYMVLLHKAIGSQLKAVCLPTQIFLTNKRGYPTLSKTHQVLLTEILRRLGRTVRILIQGPPVHLLDDAAKDAPVGATGCLPYLQYIRHIRQRPEITSMLDTDEASMEEPYLDHLQRPLQPLGDHLEFQTYETFEKDPIKYHQYQRAIFMALRDGWKSVQEATSSASASMTEVLKVTIMVVGAGRGPLVTAAMDALDTVRLLPEMHRVPPQLLQAEIWAVEKNPSAVLYLQSMVQHNPRWQNKDNAVQVIHSDMRDLAMMNANLKKGVVDIVVSELLGSFGDNELSPECLEGVYKTGLLKESTICIPQQYTSFLAPVSSMRLHSEARSQAFFPASSSDGLDSSPMGRLRAMETPYVVRSHAASQVNVEQACFEFSHFQKDGSSTSMDRHVELTFGMDPTHGAGCGSGYGAFDPAVAAMAQASGASSSGPVTIHGFLGTFSSNLYTSTFGGEVISISTAPATFSTGMFSWFPLYFPLVTPLMVPANAQVKVNLWRRCDAIKRIVWYEWCAQVVDQNNKDAKVLSMTPIHNINGRSYHVDM